MYVQVLYLHSYLRWAVVVLGALAVVAAFRDGGAGRRRVLPFVLTLDVQLIVGLVLYLFLSPLTHGGVHAERYWRAEHPALGLLAVLLAHGGNVVLKRSGKDRSLAGPVLLLAALVLVLVAVPWTRPLLRF